MDRRLFIQGVGAGIAGLSFPVTVSPARLQQSAIAGKSLWSGSNGRSAGSCRVIGIGGAGCNIVRAAWSSAVLNSADLIPEFVCVDLGPQALLSVEVANDADPALPPIKTVMLAPFGAGGRVNAARAACLRHRAVLAELLTDSDMIVLVAGLGGGTGTAIAPIMAHTAGALTVAAVVTPFDYEGARNHKADAAIDHLRRNADVVMAFSNQDWANRYSDDTPMIDVFAGLDRHIAGNLHSVIFRPNAPKGLADSAFTADYQSV